MNNKKYLEFLSKWSKFTLIMILAVSVIGILAAIIIPMINSNKSHELTENKYDKICNSWLKTKEKTYTDLTRYFMFFLHRTI